MIEPVIAKGCHIDPKTCKKPCHWLPNLKGKETGVVKYSILAARPDPSGDRFSMWPTRMYLI